MRQHFSIFIKIQQLRHIVFVKMYLQSLSNSNVAVSIAVVLIFTFYLLLKRKQRLLIPGPKQTLLLGNFYQLRSATQPVIKMDEWAKQFGPVYAMRIFNQDRVVVSGYDELTEMLITKGKAFGGRPCTYRFSLFFKQKDMLFNNCSFPQWLPMRKAGHRAIHHYGDGMTRLEMTINSMAEEFVNSVKSYGGKEIDLLEDVYDFVVRISAAMFCGKFLKKDDEIIATMKLMDSMSHNTFTPTSRMEFDIFPWLRYFGHPLYKKIMLLESTAKILWLKLKELALESYDPHEDATCAIHSILQLQDQKSPYFNAAIDEEHTFALFADLIFASIKTTTSFIYALPNILLHYPEVQKKLQEEVDRVLSHSRLPSVCDRVSMPYAYATIFELLRYTSNVPTLLHQTEEDTSVGGYDIPARTIVAPLFWSLHHDEKFWHDPWVFRPERFLDDNGTLLSHDHPRRKHLMAFGSGTRACIGEAFALNRMFVFITSLVQTFDLFPGEVLSSCDSRTYSFGAILRPQPYSIRLIQRNI